MYITTVLSYLGAWEDIVSENREIVTDISHSLRRVEEDSFLKAGAQLGLFQERSRHKEPDFRNISRIITRVLGELGWELEVKLLPGKKRVSNHVRIDAIKERVGVELVMGRRAFAESLLFMRIPLFIRTGKIDKALLLVPTQDVASMVSPFIGSNFEALQDVLENTPITLKYPFAIVGFSWQEAEHRLLKLSSDIDEYLMKSIGRPLSEILLIHEQEEYDFKVKLPHPEKVRDSLCAFANLPSGGHLIIGIADNGHVVGIEKGKMSDDTKLGLITATQGNFDPHIHYSIHEFDMPGNSDRNIIFLRIYPSGIKPCTYDGRVFIRKGSSTQVAKPFDIRRLVLE